MAARGAVTAFLTPAVSRTILVDDPAIVAAMYKLPPEVAQGPRKQSFLKHLLCTWRILADWRMPVAVCRAGFMHSVYSTSYYPHALFALDQRDTVRGMIGEDAEELVFRFCTMDRRGLWDVLPERPRARQLTYPDRFRDGAPVRVSRQMLRYLLMLESANMADHSRGADFGPVPWMSRMLHWWEFLDERWIPLRLGVRPTLTDCADGRAVDGYRCALDQPRDAAALLEQAIRQNPWAGEPRIMHALCAMEVGDERAPLYAQEGAKLIASWAVPWDKRLTVKGWQALAKRIEMAATEHRHLRPRFASVCAALNKQSRMPRWLSV